MAICAGKGNVKDVKALFYHAGSQYAQVWEKAELQTWGRQTLKLCQAARVPA